MIPLRCSQVRELVTIQAGRAHDGRERVDVIWLDACIAPAVRALNAAGFETAGSCCGHGRDVPSVMLADGCEVWWDTAGRSFLNVPGARAEPSVRQFEMVLTAPKGALAEALQGVSPSRCSRPTARGNHEVHLHRLRRRD